MGINAEDNENMTNVASMQERLGIGTYHKIGLN